MKLVFPFAVALIAMFSLSSCEQNQEQKQEQIEIEDVQTYSLRVNSDGDVKGKLYNIKGGYRCKVGGRTYLIPYHAVSWLTKIE